MLLSFSAINNVKDSIVVTKIFGGETNCFFLVIYAVSPVLVPTFIFNSISLIGSFKFFSIS